VLNEIIGVATETQRHREGTWKDGD